MMRTVEVLFVIMIMLSSFTIATQFAVLPSATEAFGTDLGELARSTLDVLDAKGVLSATVFSDDSDSWGDLQKALSASLPVNVVYNLTVFDLLEDSNVITYQVSNSVSDTVFGADSHSASVMVSSPEVTFTQDPEKVGESSGQDITLYILNCNDANGWWITGYTGQSLATDFYEMLSPYFTSTVLVNSTVELANLLEGTLSEGTIQNAVVMNTFGESVPIPSIYASTYSGGYAEYFHFLGQKVRSYNWTWVSIVGYPCYYVSNTGYFSGSNGWGIYGMYQVGQAGARAFLQGLAGYSYSYTTNSITSDVGVVQLSSAALEKCNYYGIYPALNQTASRAITTSIEGAYNLERSSSATIFDPKNGYLAGTTFRHQSGNGAFTAIGLTRIPDVRVAALGLLMYYNPTIYRSEFGASGTSRLVTLQLGQQGGR
ncbi:MAG: hypothetical protein IAX21_08175 [Candidatus Bathyarchaeota archaeon]|nr:MAG: hypothetical protein IAX21_08175 [Candidatus Bathyarchaeota archaeon]